MRNGRRQATWKLLQVHVLGVSTHGRCQAHASPYFGPYLRSSLDDDKATSRQVNIPIRCIVHFFNTEMYFFTPRVFLHSEGH